MMGEDKIVNNKFKCYRSKALFDNNHQVQVAEVCPKEREMYPQSTWETLIIKEVKVQNMRIDRGRGNDDHETFRVNFWDLTYPDEQPIPLSNLFLSIQDSQLEELETTRIID